MPKKAVKKVAKKAPAVQAADMYSAYVHSTPISQIALDFKVSTEEVFAAIHEYEGKS